MSFAGRARRKWRPTWRPAARRHSSRPTQLNAAAGPWPRGPRPRMPCAARRRFRDQRFAPSGRHCRRKSGRVWRRSSLPARRVNWPYRSRSFGPQPALKSLQRWRFPPVQFLGLRRAGNVEGHRDLVSGCGPNHDFTLPVFLSASETFCDWPAPPSGRPRSCRRGAHRGPATRPARATAEPISSTPGSVLESEGKLMTIRVNDTVFGTVGHAVHIRYRRHWSDASRQAIPSRFALRPCLCRESSIP